MLPLSLWLTEVAFMAQACHLPLAFSLLIAFPLSPFFPLSLSFFFFFLALCPLPCLFYKSSPRTAQSHRFEITGTMSYLSFIVAELSSGYFWQRWLTILAFGPHLLSLSSCSCPFFWIASTSSFYAPLRMDPHRLVSLPPVRPLLCLHLRSLHRRYNVTAV